MRNLMIVCLCGTLAFGCDKLLKKSAPEAEAASAAAAVSAAQAAVAAAQAAASAAQPAVAAAQAAASAVQPAVALAAAAASAVPSAAPVPPTEIPTDEDFEGAAEASITADNLNQEVDKLAAEIGK